MKGVVGGSFRQFQNGIRRAYRVFEENGIAVCFSCNRDVVGVDDGFPILAGDPTGASVRELEDGYLASIREGDFFYIVAGDGPENEKVYVGIGTAFEVGFAHGLGKDVYSSHRIGDVPGHYVRGVCTPEELVEAFRKEGRLQDAPSKPT